MLHVRACFTKTAYGLTTHWAGNRNVVRISRKTPEFSQPTQNTYVRRSRNLTVRNSRIIANEAQSVILVARVWKETEVMRPFGNTCHKSSNCSLSPSHFDRPSWHIMLVIVLPVCHTTRINCSAARRKNKMAS
jgi:hypothetical protein